MTILPDTLASPQMTEPNPDWDFKLAHKFAKSFDSDPQSENDEQSSVQASTEPYQVPRSLGDFTRVFRALGLEVPSYSEKKPEPIETTTSQPSSYSSSFEPAEDFEDFVTAKSKGVRWHDEVQGKEVVKVKGAPRNNTYIGRDATGKAVELGSATVIAELPASSIRIPSLWVPDKDPLVIQPKLLQTATEQKWRLIRRLRKRFPDPESLFATDSDSAMSNVAGITDPNGIHIFVDFSNIIIGFYNRLKASRHLHEKAYIKQPPFSYSSLALILERGRPVARRLLVTSKKTSLYPNTGPQDMPSHFTEAEICGYELSILARVPKTQSATPTRRKRNGTGNGYATGTGTSGDESGSELRRTVMAEQGVDEILQMKMLESFFDAPEPTTVVLASGDAAEAEFSGGFLKNVERALSKGWNVEVVAWNHGLSRDYRNRDFVKKWGEKFKIIELDDFAEELLAVYT